MPEGGSEVIEFNFAIYLIIGLMFEFLELAFLKTKEKSDNQKLKFWVFVYVVFFKAIVVLVWPISILLSIAVAIKEMSNEENKK